MAKTRELLRDGKYAECLALVRVARYAHLCIEENTVNMFV